MEWLFVKLLAVGLGVLMVTGILVFREKVRRAGNLSAGALQIVKDEARGAVIRTSALLFSVYVVAALLVVRAVGHHLN